MRSILSSIVRLSSENQEKQLIARSVLSSAVAQGIKNPLHEGLPDRLVKTRTSCGMPAYKLSESAGLSDNVVRLIEAGLRMPRVETVERLASALGVPPCWLAFGDEGALEWANRRAQKAIPDDPPEPVPGGCEYQGTHNAAGLRLKSKRDALGLSLRELADAAGVSFETIRKWENAEINPRLDTCERIAVALGVSPCWLAFGVGVSN